jgi:lipoyl-dependent peroxiredoxin
MPKIEKVLFSGKTHTTATRRDDTTRSNEGRLDIKLSSPAGAGNGKAPERLFAAVESHPTAEQLFAGAWSACYIAAVGLVAQEKKVTLPADLAVDIEVDLGMTGKEYFLQARINLSVPGLAHDVAEALAHAADQICPYSKAVRGNIDVTLNVRT